jgi:hypothetical protein
VAGLRSPQGILTKVACSADHSTTPGSAEADWLIAALIMHHVAITSTLPGLASTLPAVEASADDRPLVRPAVLQAMAPSVREAYLYSRNRPANKSAQTSAALLLRRDMDLERAFVAAGGLLLAGADPVGIGGNLPGFGDQREIELLVEAGFAPVQAIRIATLNGAIFLGRQDQIGSIAAGKNADLVVMKGDPATRITDFENVEIVFKDGAGMTWRRIEAQASEACLPNADRQARLRAPFPASHGTQGRGRSQTLLMQLSPLQQGAVPGPQPAP